MGFIIGDNCKIHPSVFINVESGFLGAGSVVNEGARIEGSLVEIGREAFIDRNASIGGGSCFDPQAFLRAGDWFHMGLQSHINIARGVTVGHEFGCGIETKLFTHGAYIDSFSLGAPTQWAQISIGNSVWMPNAWVNPGVTVGNNVIVAARSLVNKDIPDNSLAGGTPCRILKENYFPRSLSEAQQRKHLESIFQQSLLRLQKNYPKETSPPSFSFENGVARIKVDSLTSEFHMLERSICGPCTEISRMFKDQLRRNGIRFRSAELSGEWSSWGENPLHLFNK